MMDSRNIGIKGAIKYLRGTVLINIPVRVLVKAIIKFSRQLFNFFSMHWPVTGVISFRLPQNEVVRIYSKGDDFVSTQAFWKGYMGYEGPSIRLFYYLSGQSHTIIDIGANVGYFTLIGAKANPNARIYSFEPVGNIFDRLGGNCHLNSLSNVTLENLVVGNSEVPVKFYIPKVKGIALAGSTKQGWAEDTEEIMISSTSLDAYKKNKSIGAINLIKMDCEFHEKEVLEGMRSILKDDKPIIIMEVLFPEGEGQKGRFEMVVHMEIERIMRENGYYFYLISRDALIRVDKLEYNPDERNYLFSTKRTGKVYSSFAEMGNLVKNIIQ
jgi:FkbM family methyltransferase